MGEIKMRPTGHGVTAFLDGVPNEQRRADSNEMRAIFERALELRLQ